MEFQKSALTRATLVVAGTIVIDHEHLGCSPRSQEDLFGRKILNKVILRRIPFLILLYVISYIDRANVSFAHLQMNEDLHFSYTIYGLGAGIFFLGYSLFEVPSNLIMRKVGARLWIARIMVFWGILAIAMSLVRTPEQFYLVRFLLGVSEAGFFPGIIFYLTEWIPSSSRARCISLFLTAIPISGIIGGLVSGAILESAAPFRLTGWQWLFILEGIPALILGVVVLFYLTDRPEDASWLSQQEKDWLQERLRQDAGQEGESDPLISLRDALKDKRTWYLSSVYLVYYFTSTAFILWIPMLVQNLLEVEDSYTSFTAAAISTIGAAIMILIAKHSDRTKDRKWHIAFSLFLSALGLLLTAVLHMPVLIFAALCLIEGGLLGGLAPFWAVSTEHMREDATAGGIALINTAGSIMGFFGPMFMGWAKDYTGSFQGGLIVLAFSATLVGCMMILYPLSPRRPGAAEEKHCLRLQGQKV
jgi:MFS transporter, ACS family, tartrate transporter